MSTPFDGHAVVVGASLAGLRAAEAVQRAGFSGRLTLIGAEPYPPYDRPPLSKHVLTGEVAPDATVLPHCVDLDAQWRLGTAARGLDRQARCVHLEDGSTLAYDRLIVATGARARPWPNERERVLTGLHTLRDRDDAVRLRAAFSEKPGRVVVVGGGLIGCETAHAARAYGLDVTMIDRGPAPLARILGMNLGAVIAARLEAAGVELRRGAETRRLEDDGRGQIVRVLLADGSAIDTTCVVAALGAVRNTEWLAGSGLSFDGGGLDCDECAYALDEQGHPDETILVAGDVARFPHPLYDRRIAVEHWQNAVAQGAYAGMQLASTEPGTPYDVLPRFWSTQGTLTIKSVGLTEGADAMVIAQGDPASGRFLVVYGREGRCIAAVSFDAARWLPAYAAMIEARATFPPRGASVDRVDRLDVLDPAFPGRA